MRARLSRGKERVWSNCYEILGMLIGLSTISDVLWLPAEGARESGVHETTQQQPNLQRDKLDV